MVFDCVVVLFGWVCVVLVEEYFYVVEIVVLVVQFGLIEVYCVFEFFEDVIFLDCYGELCEVVDGYELVFCRVFLVFEGVQGGWIECFEQCKIGVVWCVIFGLVWDIVIVLGVVQCK